MATKRGDLAREAVRERIVQAFGADYIGIVDKKIYVQARDGAAGEVLQFAITMTMPKTPIEANAIVGDESAGPIGQAAPAVPTQTELTPADKEKVQALMERLGIAK